MHSAAAIPRAKRKLTEKAAAGVRPHVTEEKPAAENVTAPAKAGKTGAPDPVCSETGKGRRAG